MLPFLALTLLLQARGDSTSVHHAIPITDLELVPDEPLPVYTDDFFEPWGPGDLLEPWAWLDEPGEALLARPDESESSDPTGWRLVTRSAPGLDLHGTLALPRSSGSGFLRRTFRIPAAPLTASPASERDYLAARLAQARRQFERRAPGAAWFRHQVRELEQRLGSAPTALDQDRADAFRRYDDDPMALFAGGRALAENLQLERAIPIGGPVEPTVAIETIRGLEVRSFDWKPLLTDAAPDLDPLARLVPHDQHALFFRSFQDLVDTIDGAKTWGLGPALLEERAVDAGTFERVPRQLAIELDEVVRAFGPRLVSSICVTGSDPYLRSGSDCAILMESSSVAGQAALQTWIARRQAETGCEARRGRIENVEWRGCQSADRSISSYAALLGRTLVVTSSLVQLERIVQVSSRPGDSLAALDEMRFFRQRYARGENESAFLVLPDDAIRRWCSPRWRIGAARRVRARAQLLDLHATHAEALVHGVEEERVLESEGDLGALVLAPGGVRSAVHGTLAFQTPIAELGLETVTETEASRYEAWRAGYARNWSTYFDPIAAQVRLDEHGLAFDLTVMPLIEGTQYRDLREITHGPGLGRGAGDPHPGIVAGLRMALDPKWPKLRSAEATLRGLAGHLDVDPLSWLGGWLEVFADESPIWDEVLESRDPDEILEDLRVELNELPVAIEVGVSSPLKLALFLTSMRTLVEGSAPGLTEWIEHEEEGQRFVEVRGQGVADEASIFYASLPEALILSLNEKTLLAAAARWKARRGADAGDEDDAVGQHALLELRGPGLDLVRHWFASTSAIESGRVSALANLPILNEWRRLFPDVDPVAVHERIFAERLVDPAGGGYVWNADWHTMASSVFGHPGDPVSILDLGSPWEAFAEARFSLTFEEQGLRVRAAIRRE